MSCSACDSSCYKCENVNTECTACAATFLDTVTKTCVVTCPTGFFNDVSDQTCTACGADCDACTDATTCTTCIAGKKLYVGTCLTTCPTNSHEVDPDCFPCIAGCDICPDVLTCTTCTDGHFLDVSNICVTDCLTGNFGDPADKTCKSCPLTDCTECVALDNCTSCQTGRSLQAGVC